MIDAKLHPGGEDSVTDERHPRITHNWIRTAIRAGREAFEREMRRDRKNLDAEFERFWKEQATR
jgi:hypothetical protein